MDKVVRYVVVFLVFLMDGPVAVSQTPVPIPGFPITIPFHAGWVPRGMALVDLTGDGRMEIIVPGWEFMNVIRSDGTQLPGWPQRISDNPLTDFIWFEPAVGDITGDGNLEIVCITDPLGQTPWEFDSTRIFAWRIDGSLVPGFPVSYGVSYEGPVLYDVTGDGKAEIIIVWADMELGGTLRRMSVLNGNGTMRPGWPQPIDTINEVWGMQPAVGDLDGDGVPEIVFTSHYAYDSPVQRPSQVFVWDALTGQMKQGFPFEFPAPFRWSTARHLLPPDSLGKRDILAFVSYLLLPQWAESTLVYVLKHDGSVAPGWPRPMRGFTEMDQFAIGDLFGDGFRVALRDFNGEVHIWNLEGQPLAQWQGTHHWYLYWSAARLEWPSPMMQILGPTRFNLNFPNPGPVVGGVFSHRADGSTPAWSPLQVLGWTAFLPVNFGDITGDGFVDMVILGENDSIPLQQAYVHAYTFPGVPFNRENFPWPTAGHDRWRTSQYGFVPPDSIVVSVREPALLPDKIILHQNYPNPFNPSTRITYELPQRTHVRLLVSNVLGQTVKILVDEERPSGRHHAWFDATALASGVYFYRLEGEGVRMVRKMLLLR